MSGSTFYVGPDSGKNFMLFSVKDGALSILVDDDYYNLELSREETRALVEQLAAALCLSVSDQSEKKESQDL